MPLFVEGEDPLGETVGRFPLGRAEPDPFVRPTPSQVAQSAFRLENPIVSVLRSLAEASPIQRVDPNHDPLTIIKGTKYEARHIDEFLGSRNEDETRRIMARIDREEADREILAGAGTAGVVASLAAGLFDPTLLLPAGGVVRAARGGFSFWRSAGAVGALSALQVGVSEAALQASQQTRTATESAIALGAGTALGALLGGGAAALLGRAERRALENAFDLDRAVISREAGLPERPPPANENIGLPEAVGAAAADVRQLELKSLVPKWLEAVVPPSLRQQAGDFIFRFSPTQRIFSSDNVEAKRAMADLAETALRFTDEERGVTTAFGGPPVSRLVRLQHSRMLLQATEDLKGAFVAYRYPGQEPGRAPIARATAEDVRGLSPDKLSFGQFKSEVFKALFSGDQHAIPEVQRAAQAIRAKVLDPIKKVIVEAGLRAEGFEVKGDPSYAPRIWNKEAIGARRDEVKRTFTDWYQQDQAAKAQIKARIQELDARRRTLERQAGRLEGRLETQEKRAADLTSRLDERAMELRRAERRIETLEERDALIAEGIAELEEFVAAMRAELRDPDFLAKIDQLEEEIAELRREARPASQADLERLERAEVEGTLTGDVRAAAEVFVGRRKEPRVPSFLAWMARNGGVADEGGDVLQILGDTRRVPGLVRRAGQLGLADRRPPSLDDWGERLMAEFPGAFPERPTPNDVLRIIEEAAGGREPDFWLLDANGQPRPEVVIAEMAHNFERLFDELGLDRPTTIKDFVRALNSEREVTLADLERLSGEMTAAGADIPPAARLEGVEAQLAAQQQARRQTKVLIDRAIRDRRSAERQGVTERVRAREAQVAETAQRGRIGVLDARLNQNEVMRDLLNSALQNAEDAVVAARKAIEDEIRAWKGDSVADAVAALKKRDEAERVRGLQVEAGVFQGEPQRLRGADKAVDRAVKRILRSDRDLSRDELGARAEETIDRILGGPDGRLPYDLHTGGPRVGAPSTEPPPRGALQARDFAIPTELVSDFVETDVEHVLSTYLRTVLPDLMLHQRFGDVDMTQAFRRLNEAQAARVAQAKTDKERTRLEKERQGLIRDLAATRDRVRNVYGWSPDFRMRQAARLANMARGYNTIVDLGTAALNSSSDIGFAVFRYGFTNVFRDGWLPYFRAAVGASDLPARAKRQARAAQIAVETDLNLRMHQLNDVLEGFRPGSKFERGLAWAADKSQLVNGQAWFTDRTKTIAATIASAEILRATKRVTAGTATAKDIASLAASNIDVNMARRIWQEFEQGGGEIIDGTPMPNTADWRDAAVRTTFEAAIGREADIAVVTPGLEKPLWMSSPVASLLGQFKAFVAGAHERILIAGLQQRDARTLQGLIASVAFGMLSYQLYSIVSGRKLSNKPEDWIKEGVSRSGVIGWFDEINSIVAKTSSGRLDLFRLVGADKPLSRFEARTPLGSLLGPTAGKIESLAGAIGAGFRGDWNASDTSRVRRLLPFQNLFWVRNALNAVEEGVNNSLGVPPRAEPRR